MGRVMRGCISICHRGLFRVRRLGGSRIRVGVPMPLLKIIHHLVRIFKAKVIQESNAKYIAYIF